MFTVIYAESYRDADKQEGMTFGVYDTREEAESIIRFFDGMLWLKLAN